VQVPTVEQDGQRFGLPVVRTAYPVGSDGVKLSLEQMARLIIEGSRSPTIRSMAEGIIRNWSRIPPNVQITNAQAAQTFLDYVRATVRYRADPPGSEYMQSAAVSLCAPGTSMCVQVGDCDDLSIALASLCSAYGIPVRILKQMFGADAQEHVLVAIQDDGGNWLPADPSAPNKPLGWKAPASREDYIDPHDPATIASIVGREAEFVGVGHISHWHGRVRVARSVVQLVGHGLGHVGIAQAPAAPSYQLVTDRRIYSTNRYRIGILVNFLGNQNVPAAGQRGMILARLEPDWTVEQLSPSGDVTGGLQSWILQGVARNDFTLQDTPFLTYSVVAAEVSPAPPAPPVAAGGNVGAAKVAAIAGLFGLAAWWGAPKVFRKSRRRRAA
jgi:Transglutaminase-like superfamily